MEEKGYRIAKCPACDIFVKRNITSSDYGKTIPFKCPECGMTGTAKVPDPRTAEEVALDRLMKGYYGSVH